MRRYLHDPTFSRFDTIPECDGHTHTHTHRHTTTAYTALSKASRGKKRGRNRLSLNKYLSFGAKISQIGPVDPEIMSPLKKEINANKIYSLVGKFAVRTNLVLQVHMTVELARSYTLHTD